MSNLIKEPITRLGAVKELAGQIGQTVNFDHTIKYHEIIIVLCWTVLFIFLSYTLLKRRDL